MDHQKTREFQKNIYFCFIDYAKPFDCVDHNKLWEILKELNTRPLDLPPEKFVCRGEELRWQRNRMGRTLSPPQIHQKNILTPSKFHKTTSECRQRTSGTQKSNPLSSKRGRKKHKRHKKRDKRGRDGAPSREGSLKKRGFQTLGNILTAESVLSLGSTEGNITGRKNK